MPDENNKPSLSKRELEVLQAVSKGLSNQEIARELIISVNTVRVHLRNIFEKLQVQSRTEATMRALQEGWITAQTPESEADVEDEVDDSAGVISAVSIPQLALWQQIYFAVAVVIALLVFATPAIKPAINRNPSNSFVDQTPNDVLPPQSAAGGDRWSYQAEMPTARSRLALVAFDDQLYLIGGDRTSGTTGLVEIFDSTTKIWKEAASKPTLAANIQGVVIEDEIYVPGGCTNTAQVIDRLEIFNPPTNTWRTGASLPQPLCAYAAATYKDELYLIGGWNGSDYVDTVYIYNPKDDAWRLMEQSYPLKLGFAAAATVKNRIYVVGGYDDQREYADVNILDLITGQWQKGPSLNQPRGGLGVVAVGNTLYAIGGGWTNLLSTNEKLSIDNNKWQEINTPYVDQWRNFGLAVIGPEIFAVGGWNDEHLNTVMSYQTVYKVFIPLSY